MLEAKDDLRELEALAAEAARLWQAMAATQARMSELLLQVARRAAEGASGAAAPALPLLEEMRDARTLRVRAMVQLMRSREGDWTPAELVEKTGLAARTVGNHLDDAVRWGWVKRSSHGRYRAVPSRETGR